MPFLSKKQAAWGNSPAGQKALGGKAKVAEWNGATDFAHLPTSKVEAARGSRAAQERAEPFDAWRKAQAWLIV